MHQLHAKYYGHVQGVGFRMTVQRFARQLKLSGWVKNLDDGSVEILAQGPREDLDQLMRDVESFFHGYINDKKISITPGDQTHQGFSIEQ